MNQMNGLDSQFESELRLSHKTVVVAVAALGVVLAFVASNLPLGEDRFRVALLVLICYRLAAAAWFLDRWRPWVGRWFTVAVITDAIHLCAYWWAGLGGQGLLVIPTALAATMIGFPVALAIATGETLLLLLLPISRNALNLSSVSALARGPTTTPAVPVAPQIWSA